jgi:hypothetical protein
MAVSSITVGMVYAADSNEINQHRPPCVLEGMGYLRGMSNTVVTLSVLAGAYRGGRMNLKHTLTHACANGADKALCGLDADHLADEFAMGANVDAVPTCPVCARRDQRGR